MREMSEVEARFPLLLWVVACVLLAFGFRKASDRYPIRLVFILPVLLLINPVLGNLNLWVLQEEVHLYPNTDPYSLNVDALIGTFGLIVVLVPSYFRPIWTGPARALDYKRLSQIVLWGTVITLAINLVNYQAIGGITILKENLTGQERFTLFEAMPIPRALAISSAFLSINVIAVLDRKRWESTSLHLACLPCNLLMAAGIGSRHLVMLPILVAFIYAAFSRRIRTRWLLVGIVVLPLLSFATQSLRGDISPEILTSYGGEYRDYLLLDGDFQFTDFQHGATLVPVVTNAIPKQLLALVDVDKAELSKYSAYIAQDVWGADVGIRTGIWGEFYMNWGGTGVIVGLTVFGLAIALVDRAMLRRRFDEPAMLLLSFLAAMLLFAVIGSWGSIGDSFGVYGVFFFLVSRIRACTAASKVAS
jgi:oligosaccharide repeat unit polymerase